MYLDLAVLNILFNMGRAASLQTSKGSILILLHQGFYYSKNT